jgi:predicted phosphoribosyltransferase
MSIFESPAPRYRDRDEAGEVLAAKIKIHLEGETVLLAIPNGGARVGAAMARALSLPLYLIIVRKLQVPDNPEAGFGALCSDGSLHLNQRLVEHLGLSEAIIRRQEEKARASIESRMQFFEYWTRLPDLSGLTVVLIDDGLASGFTMEAAVHAVRRRQAKRMLIAVPTASRSAFRLLESKVDRILCPEVSRSPVFAVANAYENWCDLEDEEVRSLLDGLPPIRRHRGP